MRLDRAQRFEVTLTIEAGARRHVPGARGALDGSGQAGVDPVAGEEQAGDGVITPGLVRLTGCQRKRRALFANDGAAAQHRVPGAGNRLRDLAGRQRDERLGVQPDQIRRRRSPPAKMRCLFTERLPLVEDPLHRPAGQADELAPA